MLASDEADLVQAACLGDKVAFGLLAERYTPMIRALIRRMVADEIFHQDLFQDALLAAYLSLDTLRDEHKFRSWLYGIARHTCLMHLRVQRIGDLSLEFLWDRGGELPSEKPDPEAIAERLELRRTLLAAVERLSAANRETVLLFYYEDFDLRETAATLGVSVNTVKGRLHRARKQLHQLLSGYAFEETGEKAMIPVTLVDVVVGEDEYEGLTRKHYQLVLLDEAQRRALVIWIGEFEGLAIAAKLNGYEAMRPMTQAFMARLIEASGATLERVEISELKEDVFYATVYLQAGGETRQVDARPSDAIALALHSDAALFVSEAVLSQVGIAIPENHRATGQGLAEIQTALDALKAAEQEVRQRIKAERQTEAGQPHEPEGQAAIARAFAEADS